MFNRLSKHKIVALLLALYLLCSLAGCSNVELPLLPDATAVETQTYEIPDTSDKDIDISSPEIIGTLEIAYLDVGQGDSIYISMPNGETMLIDAGETSASESIIRFIRDNNDKGTIDYLLATHPHSDHIGGMAAVIYEFEVKNVWMPNAAHTTKTFENLLDAIEAGGLEIQIAETGKMLFDYGNLKAEFIAPCGDGYSNLNNYSAVLRLTYNDKHFLFMGDVEKESEAEILAAGHDISADVLKVAHHGSTTSSTEAFIRAVSPKHAVISCGAGNSYGHPDNQTLNTLAEFGIDVKRTDENGLIVFYCDGETISHATFQTEIQPRAPDFPTTELSAPNTIKEAPVQTQEQSIIVYVTKTGSKYHSDGCRFLSKSKIPMDLETAKQEYEPCSVCSPPR